MFQRQSAAISTKAVALDSLFNNHRVHPWREVFALFPPNAVAQIHRGSRVAFANCVRASNDLSLTRAHRPDAHGTYTVQRCSISQSLLPPSPSPLSFPFFPPFSSLPSGDMAWPLWSKQALITPWEGIVWGTAHGVWRGPHRGTWEQEIDAVGVRGVTAPYGMCTAPADGVSVSTLGKCVKDSERRRWDFGSGWNPLL